MAPIVTRFARQDEETGEVFVKLLVDTGQQRWTALTWETYRDYQGAKEACPEEIWTKNEPTSTAHERRPRTADSAVIGSSSLIVDFQSANRHKGSLPLPQEPPSSLSPEARHTKILYGLKKPDIVYIDQLAGVKKATKSRYADEMVKSDEELWL